jgi:hypothetical protein
MTRNIDREESLRLAAERRRLQREKEIREETEFYQRITSGWQWLIFKIVVIACTLMAVATTVDVLVDGPTKKLSENDWKIDRNWEYTWHRVLDVEGYMFAPTLDDWSDRVENTLELTYTPIFRTGKKLSYKRTANDSTIVRHEELRESSIFTWFPAFQIFLLIPLFTFIFKRQNAWFNFARVASLAFVFPGALFVIYVALT